MTSCRWVASEGRGRGGGIVVLKLAFGWHPNKNDLFLKTDKPVFGLDVKKSKDIQSQHSMWLSVREGVPRAGSWKWPLFICRLTIR